MIMGNTPTVHAHNPRKIKGNMVVSDPEKKEYKVVFKKRRLMDNWLPPTWLLGYIFIYLSAINKNSGV